MPTHARILSGIIAVSLTAPILATSARADTVADFYKGKSINVVVGYGPGGGYDVYMRLLLRHMPRYIPGHPNIVVQNMPGAGCLRAANYRRQCRAARRHSRSACSARRPRSNRCSATRTRSSRPPSFAWLGNMIRDVAACGTWHNSGINSLDQIINAKTEVVFGASGAGSYANQHALVLKHMLGAKLRVITGFTGIKDIGLALERDEVQAACAMRCRPRRPPSTAT